MMDRKCEACEFCELLDQKVYKGFAICRRFPPSWYAHGEAGEVDSGVSFPEVESDDWCGEFKPREGK